MTRASAWELKPENDGPYAVEEFTPSSVPPMPRVEVWRGTLAECMSHMHRRENIERDLVLVDRRHQ